MKSAMKLGKRGGGFAVRIPKAMVDKYNLKFGDAFDLDAFEREVIASKARSESQLA
jgi:antitoxin component of MazEF toxin-antitoxin module